MGDHTGPKAPATHNAAKDGGGAGRQDSGIRHRGRSVPGSPDRVRIRRNAEADQGVYHVEQPARQGQLDQHGGGEADPAVRPRRRHDVEPGVADEERGADDRGQHDDLPATTPPTR